MQYLWALPQYWHPVGQEPVEEGQAHHMVWKAVLVGEEAIQATLM